MNQGRGFGCHGRYLSMFQRNLLPPSALYNFSTLLLILICDMSCHLINVLSVVMSVYISACRYRSGHESGERAAKC